MSIDLESDRKVDYSTLFDEGDCDIIALLGIDSSALPQHCDGCKEACNSLCKMVAQKVEKAA